MKLISLFLILLTNACSSSQDQLRDSFLMQYSHGFYMVADKKTVSPVTSPDPIKIKRGAKTYQSTCIKCHGTKAKGNGPKALREQPPANLYAKIKDNPQFQFYFNKKKWQERMPGWEMNLSQEDVEDLKHYLISLTR